MQVAKVEWVAVLAKFRVEFVSGQYAYVTPAELAVAMNVTLEANRAHVEALRQDRDVVANGYAKATLELSRLERAGR